MNKKIYVINPNSLQAVTDMIDEAIEPSRVAVGPEIEYLTLNDGSPGIQTKQDVHSVIVDGRMLRGHGRFTTSGCHRPGIGVSASGDGAARIERAAPRRDGLNADIGELRFGLARTHCHVEYLLYD